MKNPGGPTKVYGCSDDLIEFDGGVYGEVCFIGDDDEACLVLFSDGTLLAVKYGKPGHGGVWSIQEVQRGALFDRIDTCTDENADPYSDVAHFKSGLAWAYAAKSWEKVG